MTAAPWRRFLGGTTVLAAALAAGSYGVAAAATVGGPGKASGPSRAGGKGSGETPLTGEALAKVKAAAPAKVPGAKIHRAETDAHGKAKYEAHMTKADGTRVTVYVDASFKVVGVETGKSGHSKGKRV